MKNILFSATLCISMLLASCTSNHNNYTFQIPPSLIKEAQNAQTVPVFTKKIADTELICYLVDTCTGKLDGTPVEINIAEIGNPIETANAVFTMQKGCVENDMFSFQFPDMVGTTRVTCTIPTDSIWHSFYCFIEPGITNKIWVDLTQRKDDYNTLYSNNAYNALNYTLNGIRNPYSRGYFSKETYLTVNQQDFINLVMHQHDSIMNCIAKDTLSDLVRSYFIESVKHDSYTQIWTYNNGKAYYSGTEVPTDERITAEQLAKSFSDLQFNGTWLQYLGAPDYFIIKLDELDFKNYPSDVYSLTQLIKLCNKFEQKLWKDAPQDAADFIGDDFCIAAYKHYREECTQAHRRTQGVYTEETPNVAMEKLLTTIVEKYQGKPLMVDFWGTYCGPCMLDLRQNEAKKDNQTTYIYVTCPRWSPTAAWNKTINNIKGHHYYVSNEAFEYMKEQGGNQGGIPFKIYYDKDGNVEKTITGYYPSGH
jgi:thiol-disulfide isomerase/thioredoxin